MPDSPPPVDPGRAPRLLDHLHRVSHELRSPLTGLKALVEMLAGGADGPLTPKQSDRLLRIRSVIDRLESLAERVGDLAQAESGLPALSPRPLDIADVVLLATQDAESGLGEGSIDLRLSVAPDLPRVRADAARLRRMLSILLLNALSNSRAAAYQLTAERSGDRVTLRLSAAAQAGPAPGDAGPRRPVGGIHPGGLDVSLARALAALHGAVLRVGSEAGGGALASFSLPAAEARSARPGARRDLPGRAEI